MANIVDYIQWRGDLNLEQSPFCEVDALILSYFAYVNLDGIAPLQGEDPATVGEVSERFFSRYTPQELEADRSFIRCAPEVMRAMAKADRFRNMRVSDYVNQIALEQELQFSAVRILPGDGTSCVAFRGTDDTIVGWKEDFNLSSGVVGAEDAAVQYLNRVENGSLLPVRIMGHSKGGNLAVYAAAQCAADVQERIVEVYNQDGPGFMPEFLDHPGLKRILPKIRRIVPECSVIGMLLEHTVGPRIIASSQSGIMQHDGLSWLVMGASFVPAEGLDPKAAILRDTLQSWLEGLDSAGRKRLVDDFFAVLEATGVQTLTQLQEGGLKNAALMLKAVEELSQDTRKSIEELLRKLLSHWSEFLTC